MKLENGDMLIMNVRNGTLSLRIIGRDDVPRVESKGYGWNDGATALLTGADVAKFLDAISGTAGWCEIGSSGLSAKIEYDDASPEFSSILILTIEGITVKLTWPERTLLLYAIRNLAWRLFQYDV